MSIAPSNWRYHDRPVRIVRIEDGGMTVEWFDPETTEWERRMGVVSAILGGDPDADELTEEDFERCLAALRSGAGEHEAWESVLAPSRSLVEGLSRPSGWASSWSGARRGRRKEGSSPPSVPAIGSSSGSMATLPSSPPPRPARR
jgi:hypothetical protein